MCLSGKFSKYLSGVELHLSSNKRPMKGKLVPEPTLQDLRNWSHDHFRHICDGSWQCPNGEDEHVCTKYNCEGLFHCAMATERICLHLASICDGQHDCVSGEDELLCDLPKRCPHFCDCMLYASKCENTTIFDVSVSMKNNVFLHLSVVLVFSDISFVFVSYTSLSVLFWLQSKLQWACFHFNDSSVHLQFLDFSSNVLQTIPANCFKRAKNTKVLILQSNEIATVHENAFSGLSRLVFLDLSLNLLVSLDGKSTVMLNLVLLNVTANEYHDISLDVAQKLKTLIVVTDDYRICCFVKDKICTSKPQWPKSCRYLLLSSAAEIVVIIQFVLVFVQNVASVFINTGQLFKVRQKGTPTVSFVSSVLFVNLNDCLFGLFLLGVLASHWYFGEAYVVYASVWLTSIHCKSFGVLALASVVNAMFLLNLLTVARLCAVKYPFDSKFKSTKLVLKCSFSVSLLAASLSLLSVLLHVFAEKQLEMPSATCIFLGQTSDHITITATSVLVSVLEMLSVASISSQYVAIHTELMSGSKLFSQNSRTSTQGKKQSIVHQAALITISNALCWLPSAAINLFSISVGIFPAELLSWNVILFLPVNSVVNPIIFCFLPLVKSRLSKDGKCPNKANLDTFEPLEKKGEFSHNADRLDFCRFKTQGVLCRTETIKW